MASQPRLGLAFSVLVAVATLSACGPRIERVEITFPNLAGSSAATSLRCRGTLVDGKKAGLWTQWFENGNMEMEGEYRGGQKHGPWTEWHENGAIASQGSFANGKRAGAWIFRLALGMLQSENHWRDGRLDADRPIV